MTDAVLSVSDFLKLANEVLKLNIQGNAFAVEGEVSSFKIASGRWPSFTLKDEKNEEVQLLCFAFHDLGVIEDGMRMRVWGTPTINKWSKFQLTVDRVEPVGEGALKRAYDLLKKKLEAEGLFDVARKRLIPKFPERIGLITSSDAAAYGDFLRILNNRWSGVTVVHADVRVQGASAVEQIVGAFDYFNSLSSSDKPEVIVLTRGGGSLEDLHAFNDEQVARAVYGSTIPVVCGVGHERNESLCDFVADVRASTPSNAAERIVPDHRDVEYTVKMMIERVGDTLHRSVDNRRTIVETANRVMTHFMERQTTRVDSVVQRLLLQTHSWTMSIRQRIDSEERLLRNVDPTRILGRGYAIVKAGAKVIKDASALEVGAQVEVTFARGTRGARITH